MALGARGGPDFARHLQHLPRQRVVALLAVLPVVLPLLVLVLLVLVTPAAAALCRDVLDARGALALLVDVLLLGVCGPRAKIASKRAQSSDVRDRDTLWA